MDGRECVLAERARLRTQYRSVQQSEVTKLIRAFEIPVDVQDFVCREIDGHTYMSFSLSSASPCCSTTRSNAERMRSFRPLTWRDSMRARLITSLADVSVAKA